MIGIEGLYSFIFNIQSMFLNEKLVINGHNLITSFGESFFLNRCINNEFNPIMYLVLGTGTNIAQKDDISLGNETCRKKCFCEADLGGKCLRLTAKFKASDVLGTTEIGVANDKILISHDRYNKYSDELLSGFHGDINVEYVFQFVTGAEQSNFVSVVGEDHVYYTHEVNDVVGVVENGVSGYRKVNNLHDLSNIRGAYYYDFDSKNLSISTIDDNSLSREIIVQTR